MDKSNHTFNNFALKKIIFRFKCWAKFTKLEYDFDSEFKMKDKTVLK